MTRNSPSLRSPKLCCRTVRARSESVPGTVNVFESRGVSFVEEKPPASKSTSHAPRMGNRNGERVREQGGQLRGGKPAGKQDPQPRSENRPPEPQHEASPARHVST